MELGVLGEALSDHEHDSAACACVRGAGEEECEGPRLCCLPADASALIFSFLDFADIAALACVCRCLRAVQARRGVWEAAVARWAAAHCGPSFQPRRVLDTLQSPDEPLSFRSLAALLHSLGGCPLGGWAQAPAVPFQGEPTPGQGRGAVLLLELASGGLSARELDGDANCPAWAGAGAAEGGAALLFRPSLRGPLCWLAQLRLRGRAGAACAARLALRLRHGADRAPRLWLEELPAAASAAAAAAADCTCSLGACACGGARHAGAPAALRWLQLAADGPLRRCPVALAAAPPRGLPLPPGLYSGSYGCHGDELVCVSDAEGPGGSGAAYWARQPLPLLHAAAGERVIILEGRKATGDANVPAGELSWVARVDVEGVWDGDDARPIHSARLPELAAAQQHWWAAGHGQPLPPLPAPALVDVAARLRADGGAARLFPRAYIQTNSTMHTWEPVWRPAQLAVWRPGGPARGTHAAAEMPLAFTVVWAHEEAATRYAHDFSALHESLVGAQPGGWVAR